MRTMLLLRAAAAVITLGIAPAYAGDGSGGSATTEFTIIEAQQAHQHAPGPVTVAKDTNRPSTYVYATDSRRGTWLFPPNQNGNG